MTDLRPAMPSGRPFYVATVHCLANINHRLHGSRQPITYSALKNTQTIWRILHEIHSQRFNMTKEIPVVLDLFHHMFGVVGGRYFEKKGKRKIKQKTKKQRKPLAN
jgi:hypothetical protein